MRTNAQRPRSSICRRGAHMQPSHRIKPQRKQLDTATPPPAPPISHFHRGDAPQRHRITDSEPLGGVREAIPSRVSATRWAAAAICDIHHAAQIRCIGPTVTLRASVRLCESACAPPPAPPPFTSQQIRRARVGFIPALMSRYIFNDAGR